MDGSLPTRKVPGRPPGGGGEARARLIDATIQSLSERGYHETSTVAVTKRAGLSRGTLLHYFPCRADLMVAALREAAIRRGQAHKRVLTPLTGDREKFEQLVDIMWRDMTGPGGVAWIELTLASRSDPELAGRCRELNAFVEAKHKTSMWEHASALGVKDRAAVDAMTQYYIAALRGLAIDRLWASDPTDVEAAVDLVRANLIERLDRLIEAGRAY